MFFLQKDTQTLRQKHRHRSSNGSLDFSALLRILDLLALIVHNRLFQNSRIRNNPTIEYPKKAIFWFTLTGPLSVISTLWRTAFFLLFMHFVQCNSFIYMSERTTTTKGGGKKARVSFWTDNEKLFYIGKSLSWISTGWGFLSGCCVGLADH